MAGDPPLQRVGDRQRRRIRAGRHRHVRRRPRWTSSTARCTRSSSSSRTPSLLVITHAHSDHWGQSAPIVERAGCEMWMHPNHEAQFANLSDPDRALTAADGGGAALRRPRRRADRVRQARQGHAVRDRGDDRARPAAASTASTIDTDLGTVAGDRDARPYAVARLPVPARPAADHHRRPPARPGIGDVPRARRTDPDPVASYQASLDRVAALQARLALSGHGRPFLDLPGHIAATRELLARVQAGRDAVGDFVAPGHRGGDRTGRSTAPTARGPRRCCSPRPLASCSSISSDAGQARREFDGEHERWSAA